MNKAELEKIFDETFGDLGTVDVYNEEGKAIGYKNNNKEVKQFIFETIIPEVLNSVIPAYKQKTLNVNIKQLEGYNLCITEIFIKSKELYNIGL